MTSKQPLPDATAVLWYGADVLNVAAWHQPDLSAQLVFSWHPGGLDADPDTIIRATAHDIGTDEHCGWATLTVDPHAVISRDWICRRSLVMAFIAMEMIWENGCVGLWPSARIKGDDIGLTITDDDGYRFLLGPDFLRHLAGPQGAVNAGGPLR